MKHKSHWLIILGGVILIALGLAFSASSPTLAQDPQETPTPNPVGEPPTFLSEIYHDWLGSPHADVTAEAFNRWNEDEEQVVPASCAKCHSEGGYQDYLGADGSEAGVVDNPAALGSVINCDACHSEAATNLTSVTFPSGVEITDLGDSARCMVCHQGRSFGGTVTAAIEEVGLAEEGNTVSPDLGFINIHYYAAAASLYGSDVNGGYQYEGETYQMQFLHVEGYNECEDCHSPHTLEVKVAECADCHEGVNTLEDVANIRMPGSMIDYDGDGDMTEGISGEIETMQAMLLEAIQNYAREISQAPILYDELSYPYFFFDANDNGTVDEGEGKYVAFTPNLLKAVYNYQVSIKDPGAFAHNAKYHIELLFDSISMLNAETTAQVDLTLGHRDDPGHFDSSALAFRDWDADGEVPAACTKCHTAEGLPFLLDKGVLFSREPSQSLACTTCHSNIGVDNFTVYTLDEVAMPSGAVVSFGEAEPSNICLNCHQGRESTVSVNTAITNAGVGADEVSEALRFRNPHYFAAGATLFGTQAQGAYQFEGKEYNGYFEHVRRANSCSECHEQHALTIQVESCSSCHEVETQEDIRLIRSDEEADPVDYDGDGDMLEPVADEIDALHVVLLAQIQDYATNTLGTPIAYNTASYPYWFIDINGNGEADPDESNRDNGYATWSPNLLRAAYNYQYVAKDPGAFAHNADYILQVLYDSIESMGGEEAVATFSRPPVIPVED